MSTPPCHGIAWYISVTLILPRSTFLPSQNRILCLTFSRDRRECAFIQSSEFFSSATVILRVSLSHVTSTPRGSRGLPGWTTPPSVIMCPALTVNVSDGEVQGPPSSIRGCIPAG